MTGPVAAQARAGTLLTQSSGKPTVRFPDHTMRALKASSLGSNRFLLEAGARLCFLGIFFEVLEIVLLLMVLEAHFDLLTRSAKGSVLPTSARFLLEPGHPL